MKTARSSREYGFELVPGKSKSKIDGSNKKWNMVLESAKSPSRSIAASQ
jgi:hypothetical protein